LRRLAGGRGRPGRAAAGRHPQGRRRLTRQSPAYRPRESVAYRHPVRRRAGRGGASVEFHGVYGRSVARRLLSALVVVVVAAMAATAGGSLTSGSAHAGDGPVEGFAMWPNFPLTDY